jgi:OPA family glycerol-3-phosphate transporter-like MFS transporter
MKNGIPEDFKNRDYKIRRAQNWLIIGFLYSVFYMSRYNFSAITPALKTAFGWDNPDLGLFETFMPLVYGLSVVFNGPIADRVGGRKAFLFGAAGVVVLNTLFGAAHFYSDALGPAGTLYLLVVIWSLNGYFQSFGALSIVKINAQWFHIRERGTFAAIFGVLIRFGLVLAFSATPLIAKYMDWYWAFWIPAGLVFILFLLTLLRVADTPEDAGFGDLDTGDESADEAGESGAKVRLIDVLKKVFTRRVMWMIALGSMMIGVIRRSIVDAWWPLYFDKVHGISGTAIPHQIAAWGIAIAGIGGGFLFGIMSDRVFKGRRAPVVVYGFVGMALAMGLFFFSDYLNLGPWGAVVCLLLMSMSVNGAHGMIGGAASMDFGGRKAAATAAGLFDGMQYLAASFTGITVGYITSEWGWQVWKVWPIPFAVLGIIIMSLLWNATPKGKSGH